MVHDTLSHYRRFDRVKCRILSIAWAPPLPREYSKASNPSNSDESSDDDDNQDDWSDAWLVTGGSDSSLRKWDISTGRVIDRMGTDKIRGERTLVWTVGVLGYVFSPSLSNILISQYQRWDYRFRRLSGNGQILGFTNLHAVTEFPGSWGGRPLLSYRTRMFLLMETLIINLIK
jgi:WD40 repeat protein